MSQGDTDAYIHHRLDVAGSPQGKSPVRFGPDAVREVYKYSQGTPRLINAIGDKALLAGYVYQKQLIDRRLVRIAAAELKETG